MLVYYCQLSVLRLCRINDNGSWTLFIHPSITVHRAACTCLLFALSGLLVFMLIMRKCCSHING